MSGYKINMKFYNTLTKKKEEFIPIKKGFIGMYTCGPTVYDFAHIGNFRTYVFQDIMRRYFEYKGYEVKHVMNLTDVDDKTIVGARREKIPLRQYTDRYSKAFFEDIDTLNLERAHVYPRATEYINEMVEMIQKLMKNGYAYRGDDNSIYYDISKFKNYGKLAGLKVAELKEGARVKSDSYDKVDAKDFALWKAWDEVDGDVFWETEIGKGRPGWHIECSAMSAKNLGETFDLHSGGVDLIFPHHENEIAQSEGATGKKFVNFWVHSEHLLVEGKKMSKSLGNFYTLRDLLSKGYEPKAIRYLLLSTHYKQKLNFTFKALDSAKNIVEKLMNFMERLDATYEKEDKTFEKTLKKTRENFEKAMDNDFDINKALVVVFELVKKVNKMIEAGKFGQKNAEETKELMLKFDKVLGILGKKKIELSMEKMEKLVELARGLRLEVRGTDFETIMKELVKLRNEARAKKDYKTSDKIRSELYVLGIVLEDTEKETRWKVL